MTYKQACERGYIGKYEFIKCPYCGSNDLGFDKTKTLYTEDICGLFETVEGTIKCNYCGKLQGYYAYGISEIYYLEELE